MLYSTGKRGFTMSSLLKKFRLTDEFLGSYEKLVIEQVIPYQEKALNDEIKDAEKSHAIENFRMAAQMLEKGSCEGEFYGMVFQDSDVAKWLEAAAYSLVHKPDQELEQRMDDLIALIGRAQHKDGYLNTYFTVKEKDRRWTDLQEAHELYCAGHMMEAAVAYYEATGKNSLLEIMKRMGDHIYQHFITEKAEGYPGHPEVELALMRMYRATRDKKYQELAAHFINARGVDSDYFKKESDNRGWTVWSMNPDDKEYAQNHLPVREQKEAVGHAVRAVYLYTGMADLAAETDDQSLADACKVLWENITQKRMYITGGIGSTCIGEAFTKDYNLPNDTVYAETCASIGLMFFVAKMRELDMDRKYSDVMEQALYNTVLAGMQLDGKRFFYVNPLEVIPGISGEVVTHKHDLPQRPKWFGCACCPPNVARTLTSIADYAWSEQERTIYSHLFIGGELDRTESCGVKIEVETKYPYDGKVSYRMHTEGSRFTFAVRLPEWCRNESILFNGKEVYTTQKGVSQDFRNAAKEEKGYLYLTMDFKENDILVCDMEMNPKRIYANSNVASDSGMTAIMCGPLVYCAEGVDNDGNVLELSISEGGEIRTGSYEKELLSGIVPIKVRGCRRKTTDALYSDEKPVKEEVTITMIPYYAWGNRGLTQMRVWMPER